jgi:hypothetical protein
MAERHIDRLQGLRKAALEIAYDNGKINRYQSEEAYLDKVETIIGSDGVYGEDLEREDAWLRTLSDDDVNTLCAGEHDDVRELVARFQALHPDVRVPPDDLTVGEALDGLLNDIFEA